MAKPEQKMQAPEESGAPASADVSQTPEFQMALAKATAEIHEKLLDEVRQMMASGKPLPRDDDGTMAVARAIASSVAEMADQGTSRKRVAPEILEARTKSLKRMHELLAEVHTLPQRDWPLYRLRAKSYIGDRLIEPFQRLTGGQVAPTQIYFASAPNLALEPVNERAKAIYAAFLGSIAGGEGSINGLTPPDPTAAVPLWMTKNGAVVARPTATAREHGMVMEAEPISLDYGVKPTPQVGTVSDDQLGINDPRRQKIPVLGTIAAPAERGTSSPRAA